MVLKAVLNTGSVSFPLTPSQQSQFNNGTALLLPKWRAKVGAVRAAQGNSALAKVQGKVLCIGDSITSGAYSNSSASGDWKVSSWPNQLANMFLQSGTNAYCDSFMGFSDYLRDSRIVLTAPWASVATASDATIGGNYIFSTSSGTSTGLAYTPINNVDTFKVWTIKISGAGVLGYNINGAGAATVSLNAATALFSFNTATTRGINTLNLNRSSGSNVFCCGVEAWDSTISAIQFINAGWDGATTTNWADASDAYAPSTFAQIGADLTIIMLGINDLLPSNAVPAATTKTNIQTFITSALTTGDVLLVCENPAVVASTISLANQAVYWNAVKDLANTNNVPVVDIFSRWVSYEYSNPLGYYQNSAYPANLHPVGLGYSDYAEAIFNVIGNT